MRTEFIDRLLAGLRRWNRRRATVRALNGLSDWQLKDLGISRGEISEVVEARLRAEQTPVRAGTAVVGVTRPAPQRATAYDDETPLAA
ncbi:MAG: DUF1127 domain-containing protein [Acidiferrobacterales bacterium]